MLFMKIKSFTVLLLSALALCVPKAISAVNPTETLTSIFKAHKGNNSDKWENYLVTYSAEFDQYKKTHNTIRLLEIGVQNGGSLQIWKKYFGITSEIVGLDIDENVCKMNLGAGIETFCFDASDREKLKTFSEDRPFDIIIDDGSHMCAHVIESFKALFNKVKPGGIFIVEDVHTSYYPQFGGGLRAKTSSMKYFKNLLDLINIFHINDEQFKSKLSEDESYFYKWIESIKFVDSMIIVKKRTEERTEPVKRIMTGVYAPVNETNMSVGKEKGWFENTQKLKD